MGDRVQEYAGRILVHEEQAAQTAAQAQSVHTAALASRPVQEALSGHRWRLLDIQPQEEWDKAAGFAYTRALEATYYDYSRNQTVRVTGSPTGRGPFEVQLTYEQPLPSLEEF